MPPLTECPMWIGETCVAKTLSGHRRYGARRGQTPMCVGRHSLSPIIQFVGRDLPPRGWGRRAGMVRAAVPDGQTPTHVGKTLRDLRVWRSAGCLLLTLHALALQVSLLPGGRLPWMVRAQLLNCPTGRRHRRYQRAEG